MITFSDVIGLSAVLFSIGVLGVLTSRNAVRMLMSLELIMNAANINFMAYAALSHLAEGIALAIIGIAVAAAEAATGIAIVLLLDKLFKTIDLDEIKELKG
ncbi:MAG: NADH-quinone oxidoreductase subunit NuoK [Thermoprotei archaeon]